MPSPDKRRSNMKGPAGLISGSRNVSIYEGRSEHRGVLIDPAKKRCRWDGEPKIKRGWDLNPHGLFKTRKLLILLTKGTEWTKGSLGTIWYNSWAHRIRIRSICNSQTQSASNNE